MKEEIIELRQKGYSYNEIKEKLKCSKSTISYHCSNMIGNNEKIEKNLDIKNKKQKKDVSFLIDKERMYHDYSVLQLRKRTS